MEPGESTKRTVEPQAKAHGGVRRRRRDGSGAHDSSRKFTKYFLFPLLIIGVLSLIGYLSYRPALQRLRAWKSVKVVEDAKTALEAGKDIEAYRKVQVALGLAPGSYAVQRIAARVHARLGMPEALGYWRSAIESPSGSTDDRLAYVDACLDFVRADLAFAQLEELEPAMAKSPEFLRRVVRYYMVVGDYGAAVPYARDAQTADPKDESLEFLLAHCLSKSSREDWVGEGRRLLSSIALMSGQHQFDAAQLLAQTGRLPVTEARQIARALEKRSDLNFSRRLMIAALRLNANDEERERMVSDFVAESKPTDDSERIAFARWALNVDAPLAASRYLGSFETTNAEIHALNFEAVARAENWEELEKLSARYNETLQPTLIKTMSGWRQFRAGEHDKAKGEFVTAIDLALKAERRQTFPALLSISSWAARCGYLETAVSALQPMLADRSQVAWAGRRSLELCEGIQTLTTAFPSIRALYAYAPRDASTLIAYTYATTVLNLEVKEGLAAAKELDALLKDPTDWKKVLLPFSMSRAGDTVGALEALESWQGDLSTAAPKTRLMAAYIKFHAGQRATARELASQVPRSGFKLEELALLDLIQQ
jgi:hypothetical protein